MFLHKAVLLNEAIDGLQVKPTGTYIDCTLGGGSHSEAILKKLNSLGHLIAFDQDENALNFAKQKLAPYADKITFIHGNFASLKESLEKLHIKKVDGIMYDLGVSSPQLDNAERGFSYHNDAPLDMRMNQKELSSAFEVINNWTYEQLVSIFFRYGEEKFSKQIARKIEQARAIKPIKTTFELVELIKEAIPNPARRVGGHPAKRIFQAVRIAVNDELNVFEKSLNQAFELIHINGRIAVITFHSLEDRICKQSFRKKVAMHNFPRGLPIKEEEFQPCFKLINKKAIVPSREELENNNRARSAKLRIIEKIK